VKFDYDKLTDEATRNVDALEVALGLRDFNREALHIAQGKHTRVDKVYRLFRLTDEMNKAVVPYSACRNGCNHCCNMAVSVTVLEAREIAKKAGRAYTDVKHPIPVEQAQEEFMGKPCPFLKEGRCSVYSVRPISCRVYFNMSDTPEICDVVANPRQDVPCLNAQGVQLAQSIALGVGFADIRQWFPYMEEI